MHLVALAWIGRGTFSAEEFDEAVQTARDERVNSTSRYLLGMPLLADYLEEGLEQLGSPRMSKMRCSSVLYGTSSGPVLQNENDLAVGSNRSI